MSDKLKMTISLDVTEAQALALQAMFDYWSQLGSQGSSRRVAFICDGDGNFQPSCQIAYSREVPELTNRRRALSVIEDDDGNRVYDFDGIAWDLNINDRLGVKQCPDIGHQIHGANTNAGIQITT